MKLVIIESPNKKASMQKYLGSDYEIFASVGHVRDLPAKDLGINVEKNFEPKYVIMPDKTKVVKELKEKASRADEVLLATDPDREGEAIAWHIATILGMDPETKCRVTFNEISKPAVQHGIQNPRKIDLNLVDAQQARRLLDRFVGYEISPIVCKHIRNNLSAGRVQSVALKIIVEREREIKAFKPEEYHTLNVFLKKQNQQINENLIKALLTTCNGKKLKVENKEKMDSILSEIDGKPFVVSNVKKSVTKSHAMAPFTTSSMQQDAINKLGFSSKQTSRIAQMLYEGVELANDGKVALVTYIRSDSTRVSPLAVDMAKNFILQNFGEKYYPAKPNVYKSKGEVQDAHEAIRPISLNYTPEKIKGSVAPEVYKLYKLIYERFLASQMSEATFNSVSLDIKCEEYGFKASGKTVLFPGFNRVYKAVKEDDADDENLLPEVAENEILLLNNLKAEQKFTKPSPRYTEASLIKTLEEKGVGRPATYVQIISVIKDRGYIDKEGKFLFPTEIGCVVNDFLIENFKTIINEDFTAQMETKLDQIAENGEPWKDVVGKFYKHLSDLILKMKESGMNVNLATTQTDKVCEKCGAPMVLKHGRNGGFYACSKYPECKNTKSLIEEKVVAVCPKCGKNVLEKISKRGAKYYSCEDYKGCKFISWGIPTGEKCPECGDVLTLQKGKKGEYIKCNNATCGFTKNVEKKVEPETSEE